MSLGVGSCLSLHPTDQVKTLILFCSNTYSYPSTDTEACVSSLLDTSVRHSPHFDWVVAHLGSCFPHTVTSRVLSLGLRYSLYILVLNLASYRPLGNLLLLHQQIPAVRNYLYQRFPNWCRWLISSPTSAPPTPSSWRRLFKRLSRWNSNCSIAC